MPDGNVLFSGHWIEVYDLDKVRSYEIRHYVDGMLFETNTLLGLVGETVTGQVKDYPGYTCIIGPTAGTIPSLGTLVLELHYSSREHPITYVILSSAELQPETLHPASTSASVGTLQTVAENPEPNDGWIFSLWRTADCRVEGNIFVMPDNPVTFYGAWLKDTDLYKVEFLNWDNTLVDIQFVPGGGAASRPEDPARPGYSFIGWDSDAYLNVTRDLVIIAQYSQNAAEEPTEPEPNNDPSNPGGNQGNGGGSGNTGIGGFFPGGVTPKTGDGLAVLPWIIVPVLSGLVLVGMLIRRKRGLS
ncbi:MAG: hypothetical protein FWE65_02760 [Eggerthellaceae bacterium]|nr:hypothetical protein [Eggerthellaceae bacterium]